MATPAELGARWLRTARGDLAAAGALLLAAAGALLKDERVPPRQAVYFARQAAEKGLKATIASDGTEPPLTHDLVALRRRAPQAVQDAMVGMDVLPLSLSALAARYPEIDDLPYELTDAHRFVDEATRIVDVVTSYLQRVDAAGDDHGRVL